MILHILGQSPFQGPALEQCRTLAAGSDALLLIEDGVYALHSDQPLPACERVYALKADLEARGISAPDSVEVVDYTGFVQLTTQVDKTLSWY